MQILTVACALAMLSNGALAQKPNVVVATNPEMASGFRSLAECELSLGPPGQLQGAPLAGAPNTLRGTAFNRAAGNTSRCEVIQGEHMVVVYPKGHNEGHDR